ncbi:MAG: LamG domain-containing protein [Flavobacteriales bacterium]|nr:LamG domain-containing protein [Flavobacteriales bacterium]
MELGNKSGILFFLSFTLLTVGISVNLFAQNNCLVLNGNNGFSQPEKLELLGQKDQFTIAFWVNPEAIQSRKSTILDYSGGGAHNFKFQQEQENNTYHFSFYSGGSWKTAKPLSLDPNTWQHVAIVIDSKRLLYYINGNQIDSMLLPPNAQMAKGKEQFLIGKSTLLNESGFKGQIDDFRFWNLSMSRKEIAELMNNSSYREDELTTAYTFNNISKSLSGAPVGTKGEKYVKKRVYSDQLNQNYTIETDIYSDFILLNNFLSIYSLESEISSKDSFPVNVKTRSTLVFGYFNKGKALADVKINWASNVERDQKILLEKSPTENNWKEVKGVMLNTLNKYIRILL